MNRPRFFPPSSGSSAPRALSGWRARLASDPIPRLLREGSPSVLARVPRDLIDDSEAPTAKEIAEYPEVNRAGSYLYEPAGSIHTLTVPEDNTEDTDVWFAIYGANLNLDDDGNVEMVIDAGTVLEFYLAMCEAEGHPRPNVIGI